MPALLPTVVLVHGAWTGGWVWDEVRSLLEDAGIPSVAPDLPGRGPGEEPSDGGLYEDAAFLASVLDDIEDDIVLVGHSYGGAVMSEALAGPHSAVHLVYVAGFCLDRGEAFMPVRRAATADESVAGAIGRSGDGKYAIVDREAAPRVLFSGADAATAHRAADRLVPHLIRTFWQPVTEAPWRDVPSTYVRCTEDRALPVDVQNVMAARCGTVVDLATGHFPHLSEPAALARIVAAAGGGSGFRGNGGDG